LTPHAAHGIAELKRGGFIASYPPFESLQPDETEGVWQQPPFGLYVHLPYCRKRCTFCFYKVYTNRQAKPMEQYLTALHREIDLYGAKPEIASRPVNTIYFGGGTPTTLSPEQLRELVAHLRRTFTLSPDLEFTCEGEPGTMDAEKVACLREIGVTRLSLGVQSFDDELLKKNGRSHGTEHAFRAFEYARAQQFPVVNIDLMTGCVDETPTTWARGLETLVGLGPEHVSIYRMEVYKNTLLYAAGYTGPGVGGIPTDEEELVLWHQAVDRLELAGYTQVTGHAFIKRPEHNHVQRTDLWSRGGELLGMGVSSYSYLNGCMFQNTSLWDTYVAQASAGKSAVGRSLRLTAREKMAREIVMGLKCFEVDRKGFRQRHGFDVLELYGPQIRALVADDLLEVGEEKIALTRRARAYVDIVCSVFYLPEHADLRFHRFATEEELGQAALAVGQAPLVGVQPTGVAANGLALV
jgi:oxygen-independent coproporphyrinogen-3 oxidase